MKTYTFEDREAWMSARSGKITGSRLKDIITKRGTGMKIGFFELIAERLGLPADGESAMERRSRLEPEAIEEFTKATGKQVDTSLVLWTRDDNESIAISPDGFIGDTEAVECKCLSSARHIEALMTDKIPKDYDEQVRQYFVVNEKLETLHFVMYDPRIIFKPLIVFHVRREDLQAEIDALLEEEKMILAEVDEAVLKLSNF